MKFKFNTVILVLGTQQWLSRPRHMATLPSTMNDHEGCLVFGQCYSLHPTHIYQEKASLDMQPGFLQTLEPSASAS